MGYSKALSWKDVKNVLWLVQSVGAGLFKHGNYQCSIPLFYFDFFDFCCCYTCIWTAGPMHAKANKWQAVTLSGTLEQACLHSQADFTLCVQNKLQTTMSHALPLSHPQKGIKKHIYYCLT